MRVDNTSSSASQRTPQSSRMASSHAARMHTQGDSWVQVSSRPSSSSLSSAAEDIITTGLRVENPMVVRRRRRFRSIVAATAAQQQLYHRQTPSSAIARLTETPSSQEEYDESESESDRVLSSSSEGLADLTTPINTALPASHVSAETYDSDDDGNRTAVNYPISASGHTTFVPQPNAFTRPPPHPYLTRRESDRIAASDPRPLTRPIRPRTRHSYAGHEGRPPHSPLDILYPGSSSAAHHDAALRASLSTLLSCAAAARGLPKTHPTQQSTATRHAQARQGADRIQSATLRLVPESALPRHQNVLAPGTATIGAQASSNVPTATAHKGIFPSDEIFRPTIEPTESRATSTSGEAQSDTLPYHEHKRKSSNNLNKKKKRRSSSSSSASHYWSSSSTNGSHSSMFGTSDDLFVRPTLFTWVLGAGVVVVVISALSFSAGYSVGKEVGRLEASGLGNPASGTAFVGSGSGGAAGDLGRIGGNLTSCGTAGGQFGRPSMGLRRLQLAAA